MKPVKKNKPVRYLTLTRPISEEEMELDKKIKTNEQLEDIHMYQTAIKCCERNIEKIKEIKEPGVIKTQIEVYEGDPRWDSATEKFDPTLYLGKFKWVRKETKK